MRAVPRVALFADCFHEVNGVALTCRQLTGFAQRGGFAFLSLRAGPTTTCGQQEGVTHVELRRGPLSFAVDADFSFDPLLLRYRKLVAEQLRRFRPDLIHITGPGDVGILGAVLAHQMRVPMVASWHTNIHQFGARRLDVAAGFLPQGLRRRVTNAAERRIFDWAMRYYRMARLILAPNPELVSLIAERTGKPVQPMRRGVDTLLFSPRERDRSGPFTLGFVGRLTPEKNVRALADIERMLIREGAPPFRFLIVGQGSERDWLARHMPTAELPGVLKGETLAQAYAEMDAFVFPSRTDTYGNVIQEAMASGVPCIVSDAGGPSFLVESGQCGFICSHAAEFTAAIFQLMRDKRLLRHMREKARAAACSASWDRVFESLYEAYAEAAVARLSVALGVVPEERRLMPSTQS